MSRDDQQIRTSIADFSIHHLAPELFGSFEQAEGGGQLATPEKALFDTIYVLTPRGGQARLPEFGVASGLRRAPAR